MTHRLLQMIVAIALLSIAAAVAAQNVRYQGANPTNFGTVNIGSAALLDRTITVLNAGDSSVLTAVNVTGTGFTQSGGTCTPGVTINNGNSCTLQLRFAPGVAGAANGALNINCATIVPIGGVTITCNGAGSAIALIGNGLLAAAGALAIPALSPLALTLLALLLVAAMMWTLPKRQRVQRRKQRDH